MKKLNIRKFARSVVLLIVIIFALSLLLNNRTYSHKEISYKTVYVAKGDTLWSISQDMQSSEYYKNKDIRFIVNDLIELNNLDNSYLYENQKLVIPTV